MRQVVVYTALPQGPIVDIDGNVYQTQNYIFYWVGTTRKLKETFPDYEVDTKPIPSSGIILEKRVK